MIDYKVLAENILEIAKERGIKAKDLEEAVGVSTGYFSRFMKLEQASGLKLDLLDTVAKHLHTSVDYIMNRKDRMLSSDDKKIMNFIDCVAKVVRIYNPLCMVVTLDTISKSSWKNNPLISSLFSYEVIHDNFPGGDAHEIFEYKSTFFGQYINTEKIIYESCSGRFWLDESGTYFLLTKTSMGLNRGDGCDWYSGYELYMQNEGSIVGVCNAYKNLSEKFLNQLEILYGLVSERYGNTIMSSRTRQFMDNYIKEYGGLKED